MRSVNRCFNVAEGHTLCLHSQPAGGGCLASGEAIDLVVHDDVNEVDIAAHGVHEMIPAQPQHLCRGCYAPERRRI